jgi:hypothetical protein
MSEKKQGGRREGSGRKKLDPMNKKYAVQVYMTKGEIYNPLCLSACHLNELLLSACERKKETLLKIT